jgi:hypothetical protein
MESKMPCGSHISCIHCNNYIFQKCTYLDRMNEEEKEEFKQLIKSLTLKEK